MSHHGREGNDEEERERAYRRGWDEGRQHLYESLERWAERFVSSYVSIDQLFEKLDKLVGKR